MKWPNIKLIYFRELADQLRDRRTLFTVAIVPMLLYPLMGMALLQVGQFMRQTPARIWLINAQHLPDSPPIIAEGEINPALLDSSRDGLLEFVYSETDDRSFQMILEKYRSLHAPADGEDLAGQLMQLELQRRGVDAALYLQDPIWGSDQVTALFQLANPALDWSREFEATPPGVFIFLNSANDRSRIAAERAAKLFQRWEIAQTKEVLRKTGLPSSLVEGINVQLADIADNRIIKAAMWSKILPFIVVVWALTGAFYPAIDLCAGEKERGTFETLLSSPAARSEIALGKLATVITFSYATSVLNLISMALTGFLVASKLGASAGIPGGPLGLPPAITFVWLLLALIPISALLSAVALAAAAFARSSKEGQYYLVPLIMVSMPLMLIPTLPSAQLDIGTSLIPISGLIMLLRGLIEGHYSAVAPYLAPVCMVTFTCCWFAIKWVIAQFNSEAVLFRPSEQFSVRAWFKSMIREREKYPTLGNAILCAVTILICKFFIGMASFVPTGFSDFAIQVLITLMAAIAVPAIIMALILTRSPRQSLRLNLCSLPVAAAAVLAAVFLHPLFLWLSSVVITIYPPSESLLAFEGLASRIFADSPGLWATLLVFALAPAVFEELGFRGFILSGMESLKSKWQAILLTSFFFGVTHSVIHQTIVTFFVGIVLGIIAVQTRSLLPCVLYHGVHNSLAILMAQLNSDIVDRSPLLRSVLVTDTGASYYYATGPGIAMSVIGILLVLWFWQLPHKRTQTGNELGSAIQPAPITG